MNYQKKNNVSGKTKERLDLVDFNLKETFGEIPKSIMDFKKTKELMELIDWDTNDLRSVDGDAKNRGGGFAKKMGYSIYNPDLYLFLLKYYTKENDLILDPFMGRATRPLISCLANRRYVGYDISQKTVDLNEKMLSEKFPMTELINLKCGDGTVLEEYNDNENVFDAVITCPPYYDAEKYGGEIDDLSHLSYHEFDNKIDILFKNLYRLIKKTVFGEEFHPVIFTIGTLRKGKDGIVDMDYIFQEIARRNGFILWDKVFVKLNTPSAGFVFRRNYAYHYVVKNYETNLVFVKR
jgi:DNA modification methylase